MAGEGQSLIPGKRAAWFSTQTGKEKAGWLAGWLRGKLPRGTTLAGTRKGQTAQPLLAGLQLQNLYSCVQSRPPREA